MAIKIVHKYLNHVISISPVYEPTQSRLQRNDWQSRVIKWSCSIRNNRTGKNQHFLEGDDPENLLDNAMVAIETLYE